MFVEIILTRSVESNDYNFITCFRVRFDHIYACASSFESGVVLKNDIAIYLNFFVNSQYTTTTTMGKSEE